MANYRYDRSRQGQQNNGFGYRQSPTQSNQRFDKFGNQTELVALTQVVDKKSGSILPIWKGYIEVNGNLIKLEVSEKKSLSKDGRNQMWCKSTNKGRK